MRSSRALGQFPFIAEQIVEEIVAPLRWGRGPGDFRAAADRVIALASAKFTLPAQALLLDTGGLGFRADKRRIASAVGFAKGMTAGNECNRFFIVHCHAGKSLADIPGSSERIRVAVGAFRVDIYQTHLHCS